MPNIITNHAITYTNLVIHWQEPSCDTNENTVQPVVPSDEEDLCDKLVFPELSESDINCYIDQQENVAAPYMVKSPEPCVVPSNLVSSKQQHYIPSRKLEVLRDCVAYIFDNQISEARKVFHLNSTIRIFFLAVKLNVLKNNFFKICYVDSNLCEVVSYPKIIWKRMLWDFTWLQS